MKKVLIFILLIVYGILTYSQELKCNVQVVSQQIQGTNKQVYETLQNAVYEFMNNRAWTNNVFSMEERIECNLLFNIQEQLSADQFKGTLQVQSRRPVFNTNYNTVLFNFMDNDIQFRYIEFEPLEFDPRIHRSNLTSILAYYAYLILGLDYDSFSYEGGTNYFMAAEKIVDNAQNVQESGWKPYESSSHKNRYWLIKDILDEEYSPCRQFSYRFHRLGLDAMDGKIIEGRSEIASSLELLQAIYRKKPDPYMIPMNLIFDAKADELINIFSESYSDEKNRGITILLEINHANARKYKTLSQNIN